MNIELFLFYAFALLAISSALLTVSIRNTARALFLFFIVLFAMAGLYLFALADFVAITQIMVYVGGVLILMIFAFMLSNKELLQDIQDLKGSVLRIPHWSSLLLTLGFFSILIYGILAWRAEQPAWIIDAIEQKTYIKSTDNNVQQLGLKFMTQYVLAFEVISVFLLMTLIGAAHLARKESKS